MNLVHMKAINYIDFTYNRANKNPPRFKPSIAQAQAAYNLTGRDLFEVIKIKHEGKIYNGLFDKESNLFVVDKNTFFKLGNSLVIKSFGSLTAA